MAMSGRGELSGESMPELVHAVGFVLAALTAILFADAAFATVNAGRARRLLWRVFGTKEPANQPAATAPAPRENRQEDHT